MFDLQFSDFHYVLLDRFNFVHVVQVVFEIHIIDMFCNYRSDPTEIQKVFDYEQREEEDRNYEEAGKFGQVVLFVLSQVKIMFGIEDAEQAEAADNTVFCDLVSWILPGK